MIEQVESHRPPLYAVAKNRNVVSRLHGRHYTRLIKSKKNDIIEMFRNFPFQIPIKREP